MTMRLSISSFAGTLRTDVAVGTWRLASMLVTTRADGPRSEVTCASDGTAGRVCTFTGAAAGAAGGAGGAAAAAAAAGVTGAVGGGPRTGPGRVPPWRPASRLGW